MGKYKFFFGLILTLVGLIPSLCLAHPGHPGEVGMLSGMLHPLSGVDHLMVIVLIGFWSAVALKRPYLGPVSFLIGMVFGCVFGLFFASPTWLELPIASSVVIIGLFLIFRNALPVQLSFLVLGAFGVFHAVAHTQFLPLLTASNFDVLSLDLLGLILSTALLHCAGLLMAVKFTKHTKIMQTLAGLCSIGYGSFLLWQLSI